MSDNYQLHYIPGDRIQGDTPLDRYLPPIRHGVLSTWLSQHVPPASWLLDPFGASPDLICEAAAIGYKVLVSVNNPINRFILDLRAASPTDSSFQAAIALLASSQVGSERLEPHIKSLYETLCPTCAQTIQADAFVWERGAAAPVGRIISCPNCGDSGEHPATSQDIAKAARFSGQPLHRARALERVTPLHDPDRIHVEEAIEVYLPRAIYALITILNRLVSMSPQEPAHRLLAALLLLAFDRANTLWPYPKARQRPKQLTVPPRFLEHNIWLALETAAKIWLHNRPEVPLKTWPQLPLTQGGICVFKGRIKDLGIDSTNISPSAVVCAFPRPNQAFWTLSALWAGWLWGHEALDQFKSVLRRRRYDWSWHATAIQSVLKRVGATLPAGIPLFGVINEAEPGFLSAAMLGSQFAKLPLTGIAMRAEDAQAQLVWQIGPREPSAGKKPLQIDQEIISSTKAYLRQRGEPCPYSYLHAAGLLGLVSHPPPPQITSPGDYLSQVHAAFQKSLSVQNGYLRYAGSEKSLDVGLWWLKEGYGHSLPLSDQIEVAVLNHLREHVNSTLQDMDTALCQRFPGLTPPDIELIYECLQSYGRKVNTDPDQWILKPEEDPEQRQQDITNIVQGLISLGIRLGYRVEAEQEELDSIRWITKLKKMEYCFYVSARALLGKYLLQDCTPDTNDFIVIPAGRSNLIAYKLGRDPFANKFINQNFGFLKFRLVRQLLDKENITLDTLSEYLALDPITFSTPQIRMF